MAADVQTLDEAATVAPAATQPPIAVSPVPGDPFPIVVDSGETIILAGTAGRNVDVLGGGICQLAPLAPGNHDVETEMAGVVTVGPGGQFHILPRACARSDKIHVG